MSVRPIMGLQSLNSVSQLPLIPVLNTVVVKVTILPAFKARIFERLFPKFFNHSCIYSSFCQLLRSLFIQVKSFLLFWLLFLVFSV